MLLLAFVIQLVLLLGTMCLSARWTVRTKRAANGILKGALVFYGLVLAGAFLSCVVIPAVLLSLGVDKHTVLTSFPEEICMTPLFFLGWLPALVFSATVRGVSELVKIARGRK